MASLSYDLVVLGDDFAGLLTACLCASRGMRVLLAPSEKPERNYRFDEETLPLEPSFLAGVASPAAARVIGELNMEHLFKRRVHPIEPPCQLLANDLRLDVFSEKEALAQGLTRELGEASSWFLDSTDALQELPHLLSTEACIPPIGFWERREIGKHMEPLHESAKQWQDRQHKIQLDSLAGIPLAVLSGVKAEDDLSRLHALETLRQGLSEVEGSSDSLRALFLEKFKNHNGELRRVQAQSIEQRWGKVVGLRTLEDEIRCDYLVAAMPVDELLPLFGDKPPKRLTELESQVAPLAFRYTLNLLVHWNGLPEGMAPVAWSQLEADKPAIGGNLLSFSTKPASGSGRAILTLEALAPADASGQPVLAGMREAVLQHARERMPFLDQHLEASDSPHEKVEGQHERDLGGDRDSGLPPVAVWHSPLDATLGLPALPYIVGPKHFCITGTQTLPTLGLPGQFIAGWSAAKLASAGMGKRKAPAKPSVLAHSSG